jgi:hypothetical protein
MNIGTITREVELLPATESHDDDDRVTVEPEEVGVGE